MIVTNTGAIDLWTGKVLVVQCPLAETVVIVCHVDGMEDKKKKKVVYLLGI